VLALQLDHLEHWYFQFIQPSSRVGRIRLRDASPKAKLYYQITAVAAYAAIRGSVR